MDLKYIVDYKSPAELKKIIMSDYETAHSLSTKLGLSKQEKGPDKTRELLKK